MRFRYSVRCEACSWIGIKRASWLAAFEDWAAHMRRRMTCRAVNARPTLVDWDAA